MPSGNNFQRSYHVASRIDLPGPRVLPEELPRVLRVLGQAHQRGGALPLPRLAGCLAAQRAPPFRGRDRPSLVSDDN